MPDLIYRIDTVADLKGIQEHAAAVEREIELAKQQGQATDAQEAKLKQLISRYTFLFNKLEQPTDEQRGLLQYLQKVEDAMTRVTIESARVVPPVPAPGTPGSNGYLQPGAILNQGAQTVIPESLRVAPKVIQDTITEAQAYQMTLREMAGRTVEVKRAVDAETEALLRKADAHRQAVAQARLQTQADAALARTESALAAEQLHAYTTLTTNTAQFTRFGNAVHRGRSSIEGLHAAMFELTREVPAAGHVLTMLHHGMTAGTVAIFAGAYAIGKYIESQKELMKFLGAAPDWHDGMTKAIERQKEAYREAMLEAQSYERQILREATAHEHNEQTIKRENDARKVRREAQDSVEDKQKALEMAKVEAYENDSIRRAERLLEIEHRYAEMKRQRADADARNELTQRQRELHNLAAEQSNLFNAMPQETREAARKATLVSKAKDTIAEDDKTIEEAQKRNKEIEEKLHEMTFFGEFLGGNHKQMIDWIRTGKVNKAGAMATGMTSSQYDTVKMLTEQQESNENLIATTRTNKKRTEERLPEIQGDARVANEQLEVHKRRLEELTGKVKELGKEYADAAGKLNVEANARLAEQRLQKISDNYKLIADYENSIRSATQEHDFRKVAELQARVTQLQNQNSLLERMPQPTETLFPGAASRPDIPAIKASYAEMAKEMERKAEKALNDLVNGGVDQWLDQAGRRDIYKTPEAQQEAYDRAVKEADEKARRANANSMRYQTSADRTTGLMPVPPADEQPPTFTRNEARPVLPGNSPNQGRPAAAPPPDFGILASAVTSGGQTTAKQLDAVLHALETQSSVSVGTLESITKVIGEHRTALERLQKQIQVR